jgi:uncharacterized protein involved in exopolysaccharide biosynthesis
MVEMVCFFNNWFISYKSWWWWWFRLISTGTGGTGGGGNASAGPSLLATAELLIQEVVVEVLVKYF